jgi:hypothetical protein
MDDSVVTPSDSEWTSELYDNPCVVDGCHITCDRAYDSATFDVTQTLDLMLGDETFDNPMTISQVDTGSAPYSCESDYLVDVTRVTGSLRVIRSGMSVSNPAAR